MSTRSGTPPGRCRARWSRRTTSRPRRTTGPGMAILRQPAWTRARLRADWRPGRQRPSRAALVRCRPLAQPLAGAGRPRTTSRRSEATRQDVYRMAERRSRPRCRGNQAGLRADGRGAAGPTATGPTTARRGCTTATDSGSTSYRDEDSQDRGSRDDAWYDDEAGRTSGGQGPASAVPPGNGGTPLKWDEDE